MAIPVGAWKTVVLYYEVPAQEISEGKILLSGPETIFVIFWQKKMAVFCPCPKNVLEAKLKNLH